MLKKMMVSAAVAASAIGMGAATAAPAMAIGDDNGHTSLSGNGAEQYYGNSSTSGDMSPQIGLIQLVQQAVHRPARRRQHRLARRPRAGLRPGHPDPVVAAAAAVCRELHPDQG